MKNKRLLVITPCYNNAEYVIEAIESVQKSVTQGKFDIVHVVIENGSTDSSRKILEQVNYPNVEKIYIDTNDGPTPARNLGVSQFSGDYVFFLDADNILFQNSLRYLFDVLEQTDAKWVYGDFLACSEHGKYIIGRDYWGGYQHTVEDYMVDMLTGCHFFQYNTLFRYEVFHEVGLFNPDIHYTHDLDFCLRLLFKGYLPVYLNSPLYLHRFHETNLSKLGGCYNPFVHKGHLKEEYTIHKDTLKALLPAEKITLIEEFFNSEKSSYLI